MIYKIIKTGIHNEEDDIFTPEEEIISDSSLSEIVRCVEGFDYDTYSNYSIVSINDNGKELTSMNLADWMMVSPF